MPTTSCSDSNERNEVPQPKKSVLQSAPPGSVEGKCRHCRKPVLKNDHHLMLAHEPPTCVEFEEVVARCDTYEEAAKHGDFTQGEN